MADDKRNEVLSKGEVTIRVKRNGVFQQLPFKVVRKKTAAGVVPFLTLDKFLDVSELTRIAEEYRLPVESPVGKVFPNGKRETDFVGI